jgi:uracil-DNA glycosylase family protein
MAGPRHRPTAGAPDPAQSRSRAPIPGAPGATQAALPEDRSLSSLARAVQGCRGCDLYKHATQAVFGAGAPDARVMLVGEQPGDAEDKAGQPFVGPAGRVLGKALDEAGLARSALWITNAVKHFKFTPRGKRRLHARPRPSEIRACRPWLEAEIADLRPRVVVCMGAVAVESLLGAGVRIGENRGRILHMDWGDALTTWHPSNVLRAPEELRPLRYAELVADLRLVASLIGST